MADVKLDCPEPDDEEPSSGQPKDENGSASKNRYEFVVWHNGQPVYRSQSASLTVFEEAAITNPDELDQLRKSKPQS